MKKTQQTKDLEKGLRELLLAFIEEKKANRTPFSKSVVVEGSPDFRFQNQVLDFISSVKEKIQVEIPMGILASVCRAVWDDSQSGKESKLDEVIKGWNLNRFLELVEFYNTNKIS